MTDTVKHLITIVSNHVVLLIGRFAASRKIKAGDCVVV